MKVVGIKKIDYQSKQGHRVIGKKFYVTYSPGEKDDSISGIYTDSFYTSCEAADIVAVGDEITPLYNKFGSVVDIK